MGKLTQNSTVLNYTLLLSSEYHRHSSCFQGFTQAAPGQVACSYWMCSWPFDGTDNGVDCCTSFVQAMISYTGGILQHPSGPTIRLCDMESIKPHTRISLEISFLSSCLTGRPWHTDLLLNTVCGPVVAGEHSTLRWKSEGMPMSEGSPYPYSRSQ